MKWPRGEYNGKRIVGFETHFKLNVLCWHFTAHWNFGQPFVVIGPLRIGLNLEYDFTERRENE